jgi:hypothetical protein
MKRTLRQALILRWQRVNLAQSAVGRTGSVESAEDGSNGNA